MAALELEMTAQTLSEKLEEAYVRSRDMDAPLAERLQAFADAVREMGEIFQEAVDKLVARLREHGVGEDAPKPGEPMPDFVMPDESGQLVTLETLIKDGPVAVTFHRGQWCPYCRINAKALAEAQDQVSAAGGQIAAIVPDRQRYTAELKTESYAKFPILTDFENGYALSLSLAFWVGAEMQEMMCQAGWDVAPSQGSETWLLPIPATFVVGTDGLVKERFLDPDYRKRMAIEDLVDAIRNAG
jgi:peroxiredoxin